MDRRSFPKTVGLSILGAGAIGPARAWTARMAGARPCDDARARITRPGPESASGDGEPLPALLHGGLRPAGRGRDSGGRPLAQTLSMGDLRLQHWGEFRRSVPPGPRSTKSRPGTQCETRSSRAERRRPHTGLYNVAVLVKGPEVSLRNGAQVGRWAETDGHGRRESRTRTGRASTWLENREHPARAVDFHQFRSVIRSADPWRPGVTPHDFPFADQKAEPLPREGHMRPCPYCGEEIEDAATVCKHCWHDLTGPAPPPPARAPPVTTRPALSTDAYTCPSCGKTVRKGDPSCVHCGAVLAFDGPPVVRPTETPEPRGSPSWSRRRRKLGMTLGADLPDSHSTRKGLSGRQTAVGAAILAALLLLAWWLRR